MPVSLDSSETPEHLPRLPILHTIPPHVQHFNPFDTVRTNLSIEPIVVLRFF